MNFFVIIIILFLVVFSIGAYCAITTDSVEASDALKPEMPFQYSMTFEKRLICRSRKGVIDYYQHYVLATFNSKTRGDVTEMFPFNHHQQDERMQACNAAREWLYAENAKDDSVVEVAPNTSIGL